MVATTQQRKNVQWSAFMIKAGQVDTMFSGNKELVISVLKGEGHGRFDPDLSDLYVSSLKDHVRKIRAFERGIEIEKEITQQMEANFMPAFLEKARAIMPNVFAHELAIRSALAANYGPINFGDEEGMIECLEEIAIQWKRERSWVHVCPICADRGIISRTTRKPSLDKLYRGEPYGWECPNRIGDETGHFTQVAWAPLRNYFVDRGMGFGIPRTQQEIEALAAQ